MLCHISSLHVHFYLLCKPNVKMRCQYTGIFSDLCNSVVHFMVLRKQNELWLTQNDLWLTNFGIFRKSNELWLTQNDIWLTTHFGVFRKSNELWLTHFSVYRKQNDLWLTQNAFWLSFLSTSRTHVKYCYVVKTTGG